MLCAEVGKSPLDPQEAHVLVTQANGYLSTPRASAPRALLGEQDDQVRQRIRKALRAAGYEVVEARHGIDVIQFLAEALSAKPRRKPVDLIVADAKMPGWSGLQVLADLWGQGWAPPVAVITAADDTMTEERARRLGAAAVFPRPLNMTVLDNQLRSFVGN